MNLSEEPKTSVPELTPADLARGAFGALAGKNEVFRLEGEKRRLIRQLEAITHCAQNALETMDHGSDRYDLAVAVDQSRELFKELFIENGGMK